MTLAAYEARIDALLDGELAEPEAREVEAHLAGCAECGAFARERGELRGAIRGAWPEVKAPGGLRSRVGEAVERTVRRSGGQTVSTRVWWGLGMAAALLLVTAVSFRVGRRAGMEGALLDGLIASHVRSLQPGHLTDVLSTDQHTVKPWFNGRLDFSPPVQDFAGSGYPLLGGRLDYVAGQPVAVLVYGRRQHLINLYLWPADRDEGKSSAQAARRGYHLVHGVGGGYGWWAVSDVGAAELREFSGLVAKAGEVVGR